MLSDLYSDESAKVLSTLEEYKTSSDSFKNSLVGLWEKCVNFSNGNQFYDSFSDTNVTSNGQFTRGPGTDSRQQIYITNEIEPVVRTLVSFMTRQEPSISAYASGRSGSSENRAKMAERLIQAKYDIDQENKVSRNVAHWGIVLGSVFRKDFWDTSAGANYSVPKYDELGAAVVDAEGKTVNQYQKTGMNGVSILTPFSMDMDWSVTDFEDQPWVRENYFADRDWALENFLKEEKGYFRDNLKTLETGKYSGVQNGGPLSYLENLKYAAPLYRTGASPVEGNKNKVLVSEIYIRPSASWERGRMLTLINGSLVYDSPKDQGSPYYFPYEDAMWNPYTDFIFEPWIGRMLGKGIVEQLIAIQMRLNEINGAILENANTVAKVDILTPEGSLRRGVMNGRGGNIYTYKHRPNVPAPVKWEGTPLPRQFFEERQLLIDTIVRISGTRFVMNGEAPKGVTAAAALQQLLNSSQDQQSDLMKEWERFHQRAYTKKLRIIRNFNKVPDEKVINYMRQINEDALDMEIKDFIGEDIGSGVTIKIEPGSMIPKNTAMVRDQYLKYAEIGLLGELKDPSLSGVRLRSELMQRLGEKDLDSSITVEMEKARWENERIKKKLPILVNVFDNDEVHLAEHIEMYQTPRFIEKASMAMKTELMNHINSHKASAEKKAQDLKQKMIQDGAQAEGIKNQFELSKIQAMGDANAKAEMTREEVRGRYGIEEEKMRSKTDLEQEVIKSRTTLAATQLKNEGQIDKEVIQADLAKDFL